MSAPTKPSSSLFASLFMVAALGLLHLQQKLGSPLTPTVRDFLALAVVVVGAVWLVAPGVRGAVEAPVDDEDQAVFGPALEWQTIPIESGDPGAGEAPPPKIDRISA